MQLLRSCWGLEAVPDCEAPVAPDPWVVEEPGSDAEPVVEGSEAAAVFRGCAVSEVDDVLLDDFPVRAEFLPDEPLGEPPAFMRGVFGFATDAPASGLEDDMQLRSSSRNCPGGQGEWPLHFDSFGRNGSQSDG